MKKILFSLIAAAVTLTACQEWEPVIGNQGTPSSPEPTDLVPTHTIAQLKALYTVLGEPVKIDDNIIIAGQVVSEDRSGNIYRSMYIQDETGAIEIKVGKTTLYNDYHPGQWVVVKCSGLTLGNYSGMLQLGYGRNKKANGEESGVDSDGENSDAYETTYIEVQHIIDTHIFKGKKDTPVTPKVLTEAEVKANLAYKVNGRTMPQQGPDFGTLVTLKGLKYGGQIFCLIYPDPDKAHDSDHRENRVFLDTETWNVTTWALSKQGLIRHLQDGDFDSAKTADGSKSVSNPELKALMIKKANGYSVSQYFKLGATDIQVRTSGYARFADAEIDKDVLDGTATVDITGILTCYLSSGTYVAQFTLIDEDSVVVNK